MKRYSMLALGTFAYTKQQHEFLVFFRIYTSFAQLTVYCLVEQCFCFLYHLACENPHPTTTTTTMTVPVD